MSLMAVQVMMVSITDSALALGALSVSGAMLTALHPTVGTGCPREDPKPRSVVRLGLNPMAEKSHPVQDK